MSRSQYFLAERPDVTAVIGVELDSLSPYPMSEEHVAGISSSMSSRRHPLYLPTGPWTWLRLLERTTLIRSAI